MFVLSDSIIAGKLLTIKLPRQLSYKDSSLLKECQTGKLIPFDQGDTPAKKRRDIDKAILDAASIVKEYHPA